MNCLSDIQTLQSFIQCIESALPRPHHQAMLAAINDLLVDCRFQHVLSKGGWYRAGGVISQDGEHLSRDLERWVDRELAACEQDFSRFLERYREAGLMVTRHVGYTHFFVAPYGQNPEDFLQLEVEELQEVMDRPLLDPERLPNDRTELVEPVDYVKADAHPVSNPRYRFARLVDIRDMLGRQAALSGEVPALTRFARDWSHSRAAEHDRLCQHWLIANLERYNENSKTVFQACPMSVHARTLKSFQWDDVKTGVELGNQLRDFDRAAGYPGAWYFHFIANKLVPDNLISKLRQDLGSGYQYIADKDLALLNQFEAEPYHTA